MLFWETGRGGTQGSHDSWVGEGQGNLSSISFALFINSYFASPTFTDLLWDFKMLGPEFIFFSWQRGKFYHRPDSPVNAFARILWIYGEWAGTWLRLSGCTEHPATLVSPWRSLQSVSVFFLFITLHTETQTNMKLLLCCNIIWYVISNICQNLQDIFRW